MDLGILRPLPFGWGLAPIRRVEAQQVDRVAHADARRLDGCRRELGVEIEIGARDTIEEFEIAEQWHVRPHILDEQHLAPAAMADHDVGGEPLAFQSLANTRHGKAVHDPHLDFLQVERDRAGRRQRQIFENADAGQLAAAALGQKHNIVAGLLQMPRQMQVLPREILMDEQKVHLPKGQRRRR